MTGFDGQLRLEDLHFHIPVPPETRTFGRTQPTITDIDRAFADSGSAVYVEALVDPTKDLRIVPGAALRLVPLQQHRSLHLRPAHRRPTGR